MTNKEKMDILRNMTIIVDSREKKNQHILDYFTENKIPYIIEKLDVADYSFILREYPELNMDKQILIERKGSMDEVAGNFTNGRERFRREFQRLDGEKIHLVLEKSSWYKIQKGSYRSKFNPDAYIASLLSWSIEFGFGVHMVDLPMSAELIYKIMYYELKNVLDNL